MSLATRGRKKHPGLVGYPEAVGREEKTLLLRGTKHTDYGGRTPSHSVLSKSEGGLVVSREKKNQLHQIGSEKRGGGQMGGSLLLAKCGQVGKSRV